MFTSSQESRWSVETTALGTYLSSSPLLNFTRNFLKGNGDTGPKLTAVLVVSPQTATYNFNHWCRPRIQHQGMACRSSAAQTLEFASQYLVTANYMSMAKSQKLKQPSWDKPWEQKVVMTNTNHNYIKVKNKCHWSSDRNNATQQALTCFLTINNLLYW